MPLDLVIGEGSVGGILSYITREVPSETGSLGQKQIKEKECSRNYAVVCALTQETIVTSYQASEVKL